MGGSWPGPSYEATLSPVQAMPDQKSTRQMDDWRVVMLVVGEESGRGLAVTKGGKSSDKEEGVDGGEHGLD